MQAASGTNGTPTQQYAGPQRGAPASESDTSPSPTFAAHADGEEAAPENHLAHAIPKVRGSTLFDTPEARHEMGHVSGAFNRYGRAAVGGTLAGIGGGLTGAGIAAATGNDPIDGLMIGGGAGQLIGGGAGFLNVGRDTLGFAADGEGEAAPENHEAWMAHMQHACRTHPALAHAIAKSKASSNVKQYAGPQRGAPASESDSPPPPSEELAQLRDQSKRMVEKFKRQDRGWNVGGIGAIGGALTGAGIAAATDNDLYRGATIGGAVGHGVGQLGGYYNVGRDTLGFAADGEEADSPPPPTNASERVRRRPNPKKKSSTPTATAYAADSWERGLAIRSVADTILRGCGLS